jgi:hypothetical protein
MAKPVDEVTVAMMAATVASGLVMAGKEKADDYSGWVTTTSVELARQLAAEVNRTAPPEVIPEPVKGRKR